MTDQLIPRRLKGADPIGKSTISLPLAFGVARAYEEAGLTAYRGLHDELVRALPAGHGPDIESSLKYGIPAATNLSFAIELFLKILVAQHQGNYPVGHALKKLYGQLPEQPKHLLRVRFRFVNETSVDKIPYIIWFELAPVEVGTSKMAFDTAIAYDDERPDFTVKDPNFLDTVVDDASSLYTQWRYAYEHAPDQITIRANLFALVRFIEALKWQIVNQPTGSTIEVGD